MANFEKDKRPMLSETQGLPSDDLVHSQSQKLESSSASISIHVGHNENHWLVKSGQLGMCNDPYCTTCPTNFMPSEYRNPKASTISQPKDVVQSLNARDGDTKGLARKSFPGIMNPHNKVVQQWNKILAFFCLLAIFVDPLFLFLLYVEEDNKCIAINRTITKLLVVVRSINDFVYFLNILLQFRIAYISPRKDDAGDLVDHPKKIALHYMRRYFILDLIIVIPLPQIMIYLGSSRGANFAKNLLRLSILVQYIPRLFRFLPLLIGWSPTGFIFETAWANCIINLLIFMLSGHFVGSCWYLFGLQRVNKCLREACHLAKLGECVKVVDCGSGHTTSNHSYHANASKCLTVSDDGFAYGIYAKAVPLTMETNMVNKYIYSLFWGFQQISTLAGNQTPSYFVWEVIFTMAIIGVGLLLFALLIGNIQNFLQAIGQRRLDMQLSGRGVEQWMSINRLPEDLKRRVRQAERYSYAATSLVNEEMVMENLPEDLQRDIRCHLFEFIKNNRIFKQMDEHFLDAIYKRLRRKTYIEGSTILRQGGLVENMVFVVRGKLENIGEDGICGEELLTWYLESSSVSTDGKKVRLSSNKTVTCLTNVYAFSLRAVDLEEVIKLFRCYGLRMFKEP